jgi:hypothetical protein
MPLKIRQESKFLSFKTLKHFANCFTTVKIEDWAMAYSDFTISKVRQSFSLTIQEAINVFAEYQQIRPSSYLKNTLDYNTPIAVTINTEKVRSELIIAPILLEVRRICGDQIGFFSGVEFDVDAEHGLVGFCDYLLTASKEELEIRDPVLAIVEAKNENLKGGLGQCIAEMVAAQLFNHQHNQEIDTIYGAVTSGTNWKFLQLRDTQVLIDQREYFVNEIDLILGILSTPFQQYLSVLVST